MCNLFIKGTGQICTITPVLHGGSLLHLKNIKLGKLKKKQGKI